MGRKKERGREREKNEQPIIPSNAEGRDLNIQIYIFIQHILPLELVPMRPSTCLTLKLMICMF